MAISSRSALALSALLAASLTSASAQTNGSNSPYSRYGFGLLSDQVQGFNQGMAGVAQGMRNGKQLNAKNPASYAAIDSLTFIFDVGFSMQNANLSQNGRKVNAHNTSFDYINMGFRAAPHLGLSLGLRPVSTVGYSMSNEDEMTTNTSVTQTDVYSGDGGTHEVYVGAGWEPFRGISIGANVGYVWGDITNTVVTSFSSSNINSRCRQYSADIRTYKAEFGIQYEQRIDKRNSFVLGATYGLGHDITSRANYYDQTVSSSTATGDTLTTRKAFSLPHSFSVGLAWQYKNSLRIAADYTYQLWSDVLSPTLSFDAYGNQSYAGKTGAFKDRHHMALGVEYVPDPESLKWRNRIRYRAGVSFTSPYIKIDGVDGPKSYLATAGIGIPLSTRYSNRSVLNVSVQYEHVEPKLSTMVKENYLRLCIGLTFNEMWFSKWKVE